jgi:hypothetical protein
VRLTGLLQPQTPRPADSSCARTCALAHGFPAALPARQAARAQRPGKRRADDTLTWDDASRPPLVTGLDLELADSFLLQEQDGPGPPTAAAANAIRPAGKHYDYEVRSYVVAATCTASAIGERWHATAGVRVEYVGYDYDNRMLAGNTDENGVPCGRRLPLQPPRRPHRRVRQPRAEARPAVESAAESLAYANASRGFRPPEMTELYRLQRNQRSRPRFRAPRRARGGLKARCRVATRELAASTCASATSSCASRTAST